MRNDEADNKKIDGIDFLIKQGYKKLSQKTFISDVDLERFLNKDFSNINRTRALGFIQILEREYGVDLSGLRSEYLEYYKEHNNTPQQEKLFVEKPMKSDKTWKKYLLYFLLSSLIGALLIFLFKRNEEEGDSFRVIKQHIEENKSILNKAENNLNNINGGSLESSEENSSVDMTQNGNISKVDEEDEDLDLDKVVLKMMKERNISSDEDMQDEEDEKNQTTKQTTDIKLGDKNITELSNSIKQAVHDNKRFKKQNIKTDHKIAKGAFYIVPIQKTWVGIIYLDTHTKKDFLIHSKLALDPNRKQLIVVGHRFFKIYNKNYSVHFRAKGPVRFIYEDGELMEINKKEFIKTSEGLGW